MWKLKKKFFTRLLALKSMTMIYFIRQSAREGKEFGHATSGDVGAKLNV